MRGPELEALEAIFSHVVASQIVQPTRAVIPVRMIRKNEQ